MRPLGLTVSAKTSLIINADDFGLTHSVNRAIIDCYKQGNITSATLMANMPGAAHAAQLARENPGLGVGLHFCLTEGRPLSHCPTLVNEDGAFFSRTTLLLRIMLRRVNPEDVVKELRAQLDKVKSLGLTVSHVDSHQHIHMSPWVFSRILPVLEEDGITVRLAYPPLVPAMLLKRPLKFLKQLTLYFNSRRFLWSLRVKSNDCLVMIHDLAETETIDASSYKSLIAAVSGRRVIELVVHPYILGDDVLALYPDAQGAQTKFLQDCSLEYQLLSGKSLFNGDNTYQLINYGDL